MHKNVVKLEVLSLEGSRYATLEKEAMQFSKQRNRPLFWDTEGNGEMCERRVRIDGTQSIEAYQ